MRALTKDVLPLVKQLDGLRFWADPKLRDIAVDPTGDSKVRLHASLALLPVDQEQVEYLYQRMLKADPPELPVLRDALQPFREKLVERLWKVLEQPGDEGHYLQAASALALYAPSDPRWQMVGGKVAQAMVTVNAVHLGFWLDVLRPARDKLTAPLATIFRDRERPASERNLASNLLEDYATDQPDMLTNLLMDSDESHFNVWFKKLADHREVAVPRLNDEIARSSSEAVEVENDVLTQRQARAAVALARLGRPEPVWPLLKHSPDPSLRSYLVNWLKPLRADPKVLLTRMESLKSGAGTTPMEERQAMDAVLFHPETSERRALILALGGYEPDELFPVDREPLMAHLLEMYRSDSDAGIHGAVEWTLRGWKQEEKLAAIDKELQKLKEQGDRRWYVNNEGQTLAVIEGPVEFLMGSPDSDPERFDNETLHRMRIGRRFAIASKEVTVEQYQRFIKENPDHGFGYPEKYSPDPQGPQIGPSWYDAVAYCNWLSEREGLDKSQWCYEPNSDGEYAEGMKIVSDALERSGYRLPTEAEWEYACRAGTVTSRYYGGSVELLGRYAWYVENSKNRAWPCGQLKPNDLGLFDIFGNFYDWCQDQYGAYPSENENNSIDAMNMIESLKDKLPRLLRGGAFTDLPALVRSALRYWDAPSYRISNYGFRPSRTYP